MSLGTASKSITSSSTIPCSFSCGLAESKNEFHGTSWNNAIGFGFCPYAWLNSLEQVFDSVASPGEFRNRRTLHVEISKALLFVRTFQQNDHILDIEEVIRANSEPKSPAFLVQLRYLVVFPFSVRNNGNVSCSQEGLQRELDRVQVHKVHWARQRLVGLIQQICCFLILPCDPKKRACMCVRGGCVFLSCHLASTLAEQYFIVPSGGVP
jgi:hypothetical protein